MNTHPYAKNEVLNESFEVINQQRSNAKASMSKERNRIEELLNKVYESQEENKKLHLAIEKLHQKEKNSFLYYQNRIQELESLNKDYQAKIQFYDQQKGKMKKANGMIQSKLNRSINKNGYNSSNKKSELQIFDNKENMNYVNMLQEQKCSCLASKELQNIRQACFNMNRSMENVVYSIKIRQSESWNSEDLEKWSKQLESQRNKLKKDASKDSLYLLKKLQQKINKIQQSFTCEKTKPESLKDNFIQSLKMLKTRQRQLIKIPYLQKIDINQRKKDLDNIIQYCRLKQEYMLNMIKQ